MGLIILWKNYLAWTQTVVVAPLIARAKRRLAEVAWFLVLVATTLAFVVQSCYLVQGYLAYNKNTKMRLIYEPQTPFPAVTFCNLNPFKRSMVQNSPELTNLMAAYTYVNKVKQAQRESSANDAGMTTASWTESEARMKRQAASGCTETVYSYSGSSPPQIYSVWSCPDGTAFVEFRACNDNDRLQTKRFPSSDINNWKDDMATIYYECFLNCTAGGCAIYQDGFNAIMAERSCLQRRGNDALAGIVAQALASYCGYSDATCSLGMSLMTGGINAGYYYHRVCDAEMTTIFEDCNIPPQIGLNYTHSFDTTCDKDKYITDMASRVTQAIDNSQCGATCSRPPCIYRTEVQRLSVRFIYVQCVNDLLGHIHNDGRDHNARNDGGANHNGFCKYVHNAGHDNDFINQHARNHHCSTNVDNSDTDFNDRTANNHHSCGGYHNPINDNYVAEPVNNTGRDDDFVNQHARNDCSTNIDNSDNDFNDRTANNNHSCGGYHSPTNDDYNPSRNNDDNGYNKGCNKQ